MANVVVVGYDKMLYSILEGILSSDNHNSGNNSNSKHKILGVFRIDRCRYNPFKLFFKDIFNPSYDYTIIKSFKLKEIKARSVNSKEFHKAIKKLKPDMILVGSWGEKFKKEILDIVPCVNFHPALLPKNRGANPYFWSIYLNQNITGLTLHYMNEEFDKGDILLQEAIVIDKNETGKSLKEKTCRLAKSLVKQLLDLKDLNQLQPVKQNENLASYEYQLTFKERIIDLNKEKEETKRHLRALYPWAKPVIQYKGKYVEFERYEFIEPALIKTGLEEFQSLKNYTLIKKEKNRVILKGNGYLFKIYKD